MGWGARCGRGSRRRWWGRLWGRRTMLVDFVLNPLAPLLVKLLP
jgi:hypothetical protein